MDRHRERIFVTKPFLPPFNEYTEEIHDIWDNHWLSNNGPKLQKFEQQLMEYLEVKNASLFVNGTLALYLAIQALELRGEVITTPFSFAATTNAIKLNGLKPIFCDIELDTFNIDPTKIEALITEETSAIIPVHTFGNPCDIKRIDIIAGKYNLKVIYDAAHAFNVKVNGESIGNFGHASMFSLHATKVFHSIEGGILTFKDDRLKNKLEMLKNFGLSNNNDIDLIGINAKMNEFQAAMGIVNLRYLEENIAHRKGIVNTYRILLGTEKGIRFLDDKPGVDHNYSYFPIIIEGEFRMNRDELHDLLAKNKVYSRKYFYPLLSENKCYENEDNNLSNAKFISDRILCLPLSSSMSEEEVIYVCSIIKGKYTILGSV